MTTRKLRNRFAGIMAAAAMCLGLLPLSAFAQEDAVSYLALGDSITAGYGLDDADTEGFPALLAESLGAAEAVNMGENGLTASELLPMLAETEYENVIAAADVITITIGGNDLMAAFYEFLAEIATDSGIEVDADAVKSIFSEPTGSNLLTALSLLNLLNGSDWSESLENSEIFSEAVLACTADINAIAETIKSINPDTVILVANQYNPYQWLGASYSNLSSLFYTGVTKYNESLLEAATTDYTVVDVAAVFADSEETLTNAAVDITASLFNFDFHPNAEGHQAIADTMKLAYEGTPLS